MVKYGNLRVVCLNCGFKIEDQSKIDIDREWEDNMIAQGCEHWQVFVDRCTRNTWTPFGKPDEIRYRVRSRCKGCSKSVTVEEGARSMKNISKNFANECCESTLAVHISTCTNRSSDIAHNLKEIGRVVKSFIP